MKFKLLCLAFCWIGIVYAQDDQSISSMDFVQIQNNNTAEAKYYYEHNWKVLRQLALEKKYIASFQIMETEPTEEAPFHLILITTYQNKSQFDAREKHFRELIDGLGDLQLLNNKKPTEFRKTLFGTDAKHLN
ncbi:hypothetical protein [Psychroserpens sp. SPM9]|uniref:hypothetical protein n=1 Tax=Psychroserpens sp. SPM9 TaxID=2975598 RepID=UPI0021A8E008|nr:hypothetical protein [Psychroserpens sp. SPM9]MDG5493141.1 hypothetical protein [Psychroserpens sp. SPM9]